MGKLLKVYGIQKTKGTKIHFYSRKVSVDIKLLATIFCTNQRFDFSIFSLFENLFPLKCFKVGTAKKKSPVLLEKSWSQYFRFSSSLLVVQLLQKTVLVFLKICGNLLQYLELYYYYSCFLIFNIVYRSLYLSSKEQWIFLLNKLWSLVERKEQGEGAFQFLPSSPL